MKSKRDTYTCVQTNKVLWEVFCKKEMLNVNGAPESPYTSTDFFFLSSNTHRVRGSPSVRLCWGQAEPCPCPTLACS